MLDPDGAPLEGALVTDPWYDEDDPAALRSVTDTEGRFALWGEAGPWAEPDKAAS